MDPRDLGPRDYAIIGLMMGLLKFASLRMMGDLESELTWWESYSVYTVLGLLTIAIHGSLRRFLNFGSESSNAILFSQRKMEAEDCKGKR
jgi:hypothetical protein